MKVNLKNSVNSVEELLKLRGITDIERFKNPTRDDLISPFKFRDIDKGYDLLKSVVTKENPQILIIVDSDADGNTSAAIAYLYIKEHYGIECDWTLHTKKQHGMEDKIEWLMDIEKKYDLIIQPDSGSSDQKFHDTLWEYCHTPVLVLDHHIQDAPTADYTVIINNQCSPDYENKALAGAGVTWQFFRYVDFREGTNDADKYIDLAALGCISDMMVGTTMENRYIFCEGLARIKNKFFFEMVRYRAYSLGNKLTQIGIAFYITPLINGMIRSGLQEEKEMMFEAFINPDKMIPSGKRGHKGEMVNICEEVIRLCVNARARQNRMIEKMEEKVDGRIMEDGLLDNKILLVELQPEDDFPSEINGLLATRLVTKYQRPVMLGRLNSEGYSRGSIRGMNGSELTSFKDLLEDSGCMEYVQGHDNAAGYSIKESKVPQLLKYANGVLADTNFSDGYYMVDFNRDCNADDLPDIVKSVCDFSDSWGQGSPEPVFYIKNFQLAKSNFTIMGKDNNTIKFINNGITFIKFKAADFIKDIANASAPIKMNIIGKANRNEYCGRITYQIFIEDWEIGVDAESEYEIDPEIEAMETQEQNMKDWEDKYGF